MDDPGEWIAYIIIFLNAGKMQKNPKKILKNIRKFPQVPERGENRK